MHYQLLSFIEHKAKHDKINGIEVVCSNEGHLSEGTERTRFKIPIDKTFNIGAS